MGAVFCGFAIFGDVELGALNADRRSRNPLDTDPLSTTQHKADRHISLFLVKGKGYPVKRQVIALGVAPKPPGVFPLQERPL